MKVSPTTISSTLVSHDDTVVGLVLCLRCGRSLRGRTVHERCENCLHPVSDSVYGDYLIHSDRPIVRRLADAARFLFIAAAFLAGMTAIGLIASLFAARDMARAFTLAYDIIQYGAVILPIVAGIGITVLTTRGSAAYYYAHFSNRSGRRIAVVAVAFALASMAGAYFAPAVTGSIYFAIWVFLAPALFLFGLESLMHRVPNAKLALHSRFLLIALGVLGAFALAIAILRPYAVDDAEAANILLGMRIIAVLGSVAFAAAGLRLLRIVHRTLLQIGGVGGY